MVVDCINFSIGSATYSRPLPVFKLGNSVGRCVAASVSKIAGGI